MLQQRIKTIVVEDEEAGMENILLKIERHCPELEVVATCATGEAAIQQINNHRPQLVLLDIELGTMSGFDVLQKVQQVPFEVIFTTAFDDYAIRAIRSNAVDYILKPIRPTELVRAVDAALQRIQKHEDPGRILLPHGNGQVIFRTPEIMYCIADNVNTYIHREGSKPFLVVKTMKVIYSMLPKSQFHRVSRSAIVNIDFVESFHRTDGGYILMSDKRQIGTSKTRLDEFLKKLSGTV